MVHQFRPLDRMNIFLVQYLHQLTSLRSSDGELCPNSASGLSRILYTPKRNGSPDRHLILETQDRATPTINGRARCYGRKNGPQRESRRAGAVEKEPSRERLARSPRRSGSPGREGFPTLSELCPSPVFFSCPLFGVSIASKAFLRAWNVIIPMMIFFRISGDFRSGVERRAFDCVPRE